MIFSIIMPSYNAENTIEMALKSIKEQDFDQSLIEIIVIDGGSKDRTLEIASKYNCIILDNPERLPEPAKKIGIEAAKGKYIIELDTDNAFCSHDQLSKRYAFLRKNPDIHGIVQNRLLAKWRTGIASRYANLYGDPFSKFVYRIDVKGKATVTYKESMSPDRPGVLEFKSTSKIPIGDGNGVLFDLDWCKENYPDTWNTKNFACTAFDKICSITHNCGCIEGDDIYHYSKTDFKTYLAKLRFRVINNIFNVEESGYSARKTNTDSKNAASLRKYLFVIYAFSLILPLIDGIYCAFKNKDITLILHAVYVYYTMIYIVYCMICKKLGIDKSNRKYG